MSSKKAFSLVLSLVLIVTLIGCKNTDHFHEVIGDPWPDPIEGLRGTTVRYVTWADPIDGDDGVAVAHFEETYGITVKLEIINQNTFVSTILCDIAAGVGGDVVFENGCFPYSLSILQPLETAEIDLDDPMWNQSIIKASTFHGHPYLIDAVSNRWSNFDLCFYNKQLFKENNIKTPEEYYKEGKWTVENFRKTAYGIASLGKERCGVGLLEYSPYALAQTSFFTVKNNALQITNEKRLTETMSLLSQMKQDGVAKLVEKSIEKDEFGMALLTCEGMMRTGCLAKIDPEHIGVTYLPVWKEGDRHQITAPYHGWGIIEGAKNPVGAGLFLKEYLDVENYYLNNEIRSRELVNFFYEATDKNSNETIYYTGVEKSLEGGDFRFGWDINSPTELNSYFAKVTGSMDLIEELTNEVIETERAQIKEAEEKGYFK